MPLQHASLDSKVSEKLTEALESSMRKFHRLKTGTTNKMEQEKLM
jgi:tRNA U34 5-carboxymethylaminomethyl modifying enzyme MnmG/GidA